MPDDKPAKCKFCGDSGFTWHCKPNGTWQMIDPETATKHECPSAVRYYENQRRQEARMKEAKEQAVQRYKDQQGYL
jgi:hypothetical protein